MKHIQSALIICSFLLSMPVHASENAVWHFIGGSVVGWWASQHTMQSNSSGVVYVQPQYQMYAPPPQYMTPMYGHQCPILDGIQTVPILKTNRYGYHERVGCGYVSGW